MGFQEEEMRFRHWAWDACSAQGAGACYCFGAQWSVCGSGGEAVKGGDMGVYRAGRCWVPY